MRSFRFILALVLGLTVAVSCGKEAEKQQEEGWKPGGKIVFSAGSAAQDITKTVYESGTAKGKIYWQEGDMVEISCVNDDGKELSSYSASPKEGDATEIVLAPLMEDESITWGTGAHSFYSLYPSPLINGAAGFSLDADKVVLVMPDTQPPLNSTTVTESGVTTTTLSPNMVYAPLIASTQITDPTVVASVPLRYRAAFTAFEFIVKVADANGILRLKDFTFTSGGTVLAAASVSATIHGTGSDVYLSADDNFLSTAFKGESVPNNQPEGITWKGSSNSGNGSGSNVAGASAMVSNVVTVPLGTEQNPFILTGDNILVFTVLTLSFEDIREVTVRFNTTNGYRSLGLKYDATYFANNRDALISNGKADENGWMIFPKGKKNTFAGFNVPGHFYITYDDITIGGVPYEPVDPGAGWSFIFEELELGKAVINGQNVTQISAGGGVWSDVAYDIYLETAVINGQNVTTHNPDSAWEPILEPISNIHIGSGGQPYENDNASGGNWS